MKGTKQLKGGERRTPITQLVTPSPLLPALLDEPIIVKLLYLWLDPQQAAPYSQRQIARALGISQGSVSLSLKRLRGLELGSTYEAPVGATSGLPGGQPEVQALALPERLLEENQTAKLVYLYLEPYGEVEVSVRQLEGLLGISHRNATEALQRLVELGLLEGLEPAVNRAGRYRVNTK